MVESYLHILGIDRTATLNEIKKAYRIKAKELHPDMNDAPDAQEKFVSLNEAYEYLLDNWQYLRPKIQATPEEIKEQKEREKAYREWLIKESMRIRKKAEEMARMKFEEYKKTPIYRTTQRLMTMADYFAILFGCSIVAVTIWAIIRQYKQGFEMLGTILIAVLTVPVGGIIIFYTIFQMRKSNKDK